MHDLITVGIPLLAILAGILLNRNDAASIRADLHTVASSLRAELRNDAASIRAELHDEAKNIRGEIQVRHQEVLARFNVLESDMRQFYHLTGKLEARMDSLEKQP